MDQPAFNPVHALAQQLVEQNQKMLDEMNRYRQEYVATAKVMEGFPYGPFRHYGEEARLIELYRKDPKAREELRLVYNKYAAASTGGKPAPTPEPGGAHV